MFKRYANLLFALGGKMRNARSTVVSLAAAVAVLLGIVGTSDGANVPMGNGFTDHGKPAPYCSRRGTVATRDGAGRDCILSWFQDWTTAYHFKLVMVDAETGNSSQWEPPISSTGDAPFASILSTKNRLYTCVLGVFWEFDVATRNFTFATRLSNRNYLAMSFTESDDGTIWAAMYPDGALVSFDPVARTIKDWKSLFGTNWNQYPRYMATEPDGKWVYFGTGMARSQVVALDVVAGTAKTLFPEDKRLPLFVATVVRDTDGEVRGHRGNASLGWFVVKQGQLTWLNGTVNRKSKQYIAGTQGLFWSIFPSGNTLVSLDTYAHTFTVRNVTTKQSVTKSFEYTAVGGYITSLCVTPMGTIAGGTQFPFRFFEYDPGTGVLIDRVHEVQANTVATMKDKWYVGAYTGGYIFEWDPQRPWNITLPTSNSARNPRQLAMAEPVIDRPTELLAVPERDLLILAGTPAYGATGGGLMFQDVSRGTTEIVPHDRIIFNESTVGLALLRDGETLFGATTTLAGTGGEKGATVAEFYLMNLTTKKVLWHEAVLPDVGAYHDVMLGPHGEVLVLLTTGRLLVFDAAQRKIVAQRMGNKTCAGTNWNQGPRTFVCHANGDIFLLFAKCILKLDPATYNMTVVAVSPVTIKAGGDIVGDSVFFSSSSNLCSFAIPPQFLSSSSSSQAGSSSSSQTGSSSSSSQSSGSVAGSQRSSRMVPTSGSPSRGQAGLLAYAILLWAFVTTHPSE